MNESTRREVNLKYDDEPSYHHIFNFNFSLPYIKNKRVLDIGCWTGQFEKLATRETKQMVGIDPGVNAIKHAKKMVPTATFKVANALRLSFSPRSFDVVTIIDVIEHIPKNNEEKCLNEIKRVLKPGGYIILSTPNAHPLSILLDPAFFLIGHRHYSEKTLRMLFKNAGFEIIKVKKTGGVFRMSVTIVEYIYKHIFKTKFVIPTFVEKLIRNEYKSSKAFSQVNVVGKLKG